MNNFTSKEDYMKWLDEEERWRPINQYLDIEDCYEVSSYGRIRNIKYDKILDDIHHSTNGFDYIFIATKNHEPSYQHLDLIVCMTFWAWNVNHLPLGKPIIPNHIDGDKRNNKASNLEFILDEEVWKPVVYDDIIVGMYEVSNHGNARNIIGKFQCQINLNPSYYPKCKFNTSSGMKAYDLHRIIAHTFISGYDKVHKIVNHLDNSKINNHWRNIEWCDYSWNNAHSMTLATCSISNPRFTIDELDYIRTLLFNYESSSKAYEIYQSANNTQIRDLTVQQFRDVKKGYCCHSSFKFTQNEVLHLMML